MPKESKAKTKSAHKLALIFVGAVICVVLLLLSTVRFVVERNATIRVTHAEYTLKAHVADDENERSTGLSGVESLETGESLLFWYDSEQLPGIWMKDMLIPIDIIWLNAEKRVVSIKERVSPQTYPLVYYPSAPAQYVLEVPAGYIVETGVKVGDQFSF